MTSYEKPEFCKIEKTHDNIIRVRFAENITEVETETGPAYTYDETTWESKWSEPLAASIRRNPDAFLAKLKKLNG